MKHIQLILLLSLLAACSKKPDAPTPQPAASTPPTTTNPKPPPPSPVTNCQGATVLYSSPVDTMPSDPVPNSKTYVIPGFELSCGDTVQVYFVAFGTPPTPLQQGANGASYYTIFNQTVTVYNSTGHSVNVDIEAVLK
jgi:hypothetical protein